MDLRSYCPPAVTPALAKPELYEYLEQGKIWYAMLGFPPIR